VTWDTQYSSPAAAPWLEPHTIMASGNKVIAVIHIEADHKGKHYVIPNEGHLWTFGAGGKVTDYQHMTDTAAHWGMANGR